MAFRVLHVVPSLGPLRGGPSIAVPTMASGLRRLGVDVHIAATDDNGVGHLTIPRGQPLTTDGITYWYFHRQMLFYTVSWPLTWWLYENISAYDLVHIHALFSYPSIVAALCAAYARVPYVVRPLGTLNQWGMQYYKPRLKRISLHFLERHLLTHAAAVQFTSEQERIEAEELGVPMHSVVLPLGLDLDALPPPTPGSFRQANPRLADKTLILFLSRIEQKKGLELLLDAFAHVYARHPQTMLVIAGQGDLAYEESIRDYIQALNLEEAVLVTGFISGTEKQAAFSDCDLFILPSYSENFGFAPVEALANGLPVILTDRVGVAPEVAAAGAGLVVGANQAELTTALETLICDQALRGEMQTKARQLAWQHFSLTSTTQQLMTLYQELLHRRQPAPSYSFGVKESYD